VEEKMEEINEGSNVKSTSNGEIGRKRRQLQKRPRKGLEE
jgi:hypothetical protein